MKDNISKLSNCYGCGVCATACPAKIIHMRENGEGFYSPYIADNDKCINCGICLKVCAFCHEDVAQEAELPVQGYAGWSKDENTRLLCSSGGVGFEIGKHLIEKGYKACVVKYDTTRRRALHYIAHNVDDLAYSVGSKYIPSLTTEGFTKVNRNAKTVVVGTPCQIDSFRRYIKHFKKEENFVLIDFFCHGTPSLLLWDKYIFEVEQKTGESVFVSWRNKLEGWHDSWNILARGAKQQVRTNGLKPIDWHKSYALYVRGKNTYTFLNCLRGTCFTNSSWETCAWAAAAIPANTKVAVLPPTYALAICGGRSTKTTQKARAQFSPLPSEDKP